MDNKYTNYVLLEMNSGDRNESIEGSNAEPHPITKIVNKNINACVQEVWNHFDIITNSGFGHTFYDTSEALRDSKHSFGIELRVPINSKNECPHCNDISCVVPQGNTRSIAQGPRNGTYSAMWHSRYPDGTPEMPLRCETNNTFTTKEMHFTIQILQDEIDNCVKSFGRGIKTNSFKKIAQEMWLSLDREDKKKYVPVGFRYGVDGHIIALDTNGYPVVDTAATYGSKYSKYTSHKQRRERRPNKVLTIIFREK